MQDQEIGRIRANRVNSPRRKSTLTDFDLSNLLNAAAKSLTWLTSMLPTAKITDLGELDWNSAKTACEELILNGYSDWHLPSKEKLNQAKVS